MAELKTCSKCKKTFPATLEYFHRNHGKLRSSCKSCERKRRRAQHLKSLYNIDCSEYGKLLAKQGYKCAICDKKLKKSKKEGKHAAVDHCHKTGKIRGILCHQCNRGLGMLGDTLCQLKKAVKYLSEAQ